MHICSKCNGNPSHARSFWNNMVDRRTELDNALSPGWNRTGLIRSDLLKTWRNMLGTDNNTSISKQMRDWKWQKTCFVGREDGLKDEDKYAMFSNGVIPVLWQKYVCPELVAHRLLRRRGKLELAKQIRCHCAENAIFHLYQPLISKGQEEVLKDGIKHTNKWEKWARRRNCVSAEH